MAKKAAKKSFKSLPKKAQKAAFASMEKEGKLGKKNPSTGKRMVALTSKNAPHRKK